MFRLTVFLCLGIFLTLQFAGTDRGQMRFGLLEAEAEVEKLAVSNVPTGTEPPETVTRSAVVAAAEPLVAKPVPAARVVPVVFAPAPAVAPAAPVRAAVQASEPAPEVRYVTGRSVNVRGGPSTSDEIVGRLTRGEAVTIIALDGQWARIRVEGDGVEGFMSADFLSSTAP